MISSLQRFLCLFSFLLVVLVSYSQKEVRPKPSPRQQQWSDMEFYLFAHFGPNTFTDLEWGKGNEKEEVFNPTNLDCRQWCRIAKAAGAKGIIITAKHHDGFCLWPSEYSTHTVRESKWRDGKGDVLKELSQACKEYSLKMGVYLSPWDRNHPKYGTPDYNEVFENMMKEVVRRYGPYFEFWWDGANGEGPNGKKQMYDWAKFRATIREVAPNTAVFSDVGPDIRWVGNEKGIAGKTNWNSLDTIGFTPGLGAPSSDTLNVGNRYGKAWIPAECDVSIRPGWFYHSSEDTAVKTPARLFDLYLKSVGRGASLLLNVPPDRKGLFTSFDSAALLGFKKLRDESFRHNLLLKTNAITDGKKVSTVNDGSDETITPVKVNTALTIDLPKSTEMNCVLLKEYLKNGQSIGHFKIVLYDDQNKVVKETEGTTVGRKRIFTFPTVDVKKISFTATEEDAPASLSEIEAYRIDDSLIEK